MLTEAGRNKETDMHTPEKAATLQALLKATTERRDAADLLGFRNLACEMEIHCQRLETMIRRPDCDPIICLAASFTQFEMN
jgi:hypothetical protein